MLLARASADAAFGQSMQLDRNPFVDKLGWRFQAFAALYGRTPTVPLALLAKAIVSAHIGAVSQSPADGDAACTRLVVVTGIIRSLTDEHPAPGA